MLRAVCAPRHVIERGSDVTGHTSVASSLSAETGHSCGCRLAADDGRSTGTTPPPPPLLPASHLPDDDNAAASGEYGPSPTSGVNDDVIGQLVLDGART